MVGGIRIDDENPLPARRVGQADARNRLRHRAELRIRFVAAAGRRHAVVSAYERGGLRGEIGFDPIDIGVSLVAKRCERDARTRIIVEKPLGDIVDRATHRRQVVGERRCEILQDHDIERSGRPPQDDGLVAETGGFHAAQRIGSVRLRAARVGHHETICALRDRVLRPRPRKCRKVPTCATGQRIVAPFAGQFVALPAAAQIVDDRIADQHIASSAAPCVFDQRDLIVIVEKRIRDIAGREIRGAAAAIEIGQLRRVERRPCAGLQRNAQIGRIVAQVVGVDAAAIPDRAKDSVAAGRRLRHAVDRHRARGRREGVDRVAAPERAGRREICAIHVLQSGDVEHHVALRVAPLLVFGRRGRRIAKVVAIRHHGIGVEVQIRRQSAIAACIVAMFQPQRMTQLMHESFVIRVGAEHRIAVCACGAEPRIAPRRDRRGIITPGGRVERIVRESEPKGGVRNLALGDLVETQVGEAGQLVEKRPGRALLLGCQRMERRRLGGHVVTVVKCARRRKTVGQGRGVPPHARQNAVKIRERLSDVGDIGHRKPLLSKTGSIKRFAPYGAHAYADVMNEIARRH